MIRRNIRIYLKTIARNRLSFFINFFGLSLALAAAFLIYVYIRYESGYDQHLGPEVYRISIQKQEQGKVTYQSAKSYSGLADLCKEVPAIVGSTRILYEQCLFRFGNKKLANQRVFWADSSFVEVFSLRMLEGGRKHLLSAPHEAIISRTTAVKLFGQDWQNREDVLESTILLNEGLPFKIAGIFEDYPESSHVAFDYVLSFPTLTKILGKGWGEIMPPGPNFVYTYVKLNQNSSSTLAEAQINALFKKRITQKEEASYQLNFQQASSIHVDSHLSDELMPNGNRDLLQLLKLVAGLIILIAMINYINLSVSMATKRVPEIGMRKVLGATTKHLAFQFATDSILSFLIVFAISFLLVRAFIDIFYQYLQIQIPNSFYYSADLWGNVLLLIAFVTLVPAVYLGLTMTRVKPISAGVSQATAFGRVGYFRKSLVVLQFVAATFLISSTILISRQVHLMQHYQLGYDKQNVVVIKSPRTLIGNPEREKLFEVFKTRLRSSPSVVSVASGSVVPGEEFLIRAENVKRTGEAPMEGESFSVGFTDGDFFKTLGIRVVAGRTFSTKQRSPEAIINRTALKALGFSSPQDALGKEIRVLFADDKRTIVGVIEDYHHLSVHTMPSATIFLHGPDYEFGYYPIRIQGSQLQSTLGAMTKAWEELYPNDPFDYFFLDSFFAKQYQSEVRFERVFFSFSLLAILISCLGLFGLSLYSMQLRQREVCIRRIFGASTPNNILLLSKEYIRMILVAIGMAMPLVVYFSNSFLRSFPYRVNQGPAYYCLAGIMMLVISFVTILYNVLKVSGQNPANVLRNQ